MHFQRSGIEGHCPLTGCFHLQRSSIAEYTTSCRPSSHSRRKLTLPSQGLITLVPLDQGPSRIRRKDQRRSFRLQGHLQMSAATALIGCMPFILLIFFLLVIHSIFHSLRFSVSSAGSASTPRHSFFVYAVIFSPEQSRPLYFNTFNTREVVIAQAGLGIFTPIHFYIDTVQHILTIRNLLDPSLPTSNPFPKYQYA